MTDAGRLYTPAEAGAVSGLKLKAVHNAIDKRIVEPVAKARVPPIGATQRVPRFLTGEDLVRLRVWRGVGDTLSAERRQLLFVAIAAKPAAKTVKADELLIVDVGKDKATLGGEPVFKGTRIPVYGIAAMLDAGAMADELLSGYPKLTERLLDLARIWAAAHPRRGRPKSLSDLGLKVKSTRRVTRKNDPLAGRLKAAATG
jgi:uncharacterized protein (DUF433 family)